MDFDDLLRDSRQYDNDGLSLDKPKMDDPTTIEFGKLQIFSPPVEDETEEPVPYHKPRVKGNTKTYQFGRDYIAPSKNMIVPFKSVGKFTVNWIHDNYLFGLINDDKPACYEIATAVWYKCTKWEPLCYTKSKIQALLAEGEIDFLIATENASRMTRQGDAIVDYLCTCDVDSKEAKQALNVMTDGRFNMDWKLIKIHSKTKNAWMMNGRYLNIEDLLRELSMVQHY